MHSTRHTSYLIYGPFAMVIPNRIKPFSKHTLAFRFFFLLFYHLQSSTSLIYGNRSVVFRFNKKINHRYCRRHKFERSFSIPCTLPLFIVPISFYICLFVYVHLCWFQICFSFSFRCLKVGCICLYKLWTTLAIETADEGWLFYDQNIKFFGFFIGLLWKIKK